MSNSSILNDLNEIRNQPPSTSIKDDLNEIRGIKPKPDLTKQNQVIDQMQKDNPPWESTDVMQSGGFENPVKELPEDWEKAKTIASRLFQSTKNNLTGAGQLAYGEFAHP